MGTGDTEEQSLGSVVWIGIGGAVGAVLRHVVSGHIQGQFRLGGFPYGTLAVNVIGCLLIGLFSQVAQRPGRFTSEGVLFLFVGMLGAFTTFSTFGKETVDLLHSGRTVAALANVGIHVVAGLAAVGGGYELGRFLQW
jgi:CrcB protein